MDYAINKSLSLEARWDRRRLDHVIEDSSMINAGNETFVIGNPGQGAERTFDGFYNFLYGTAPPVCAGAQCPEQHMIAAARSYDGLEFRLTKAQGHHWFGMFSYTYSHLRGNYTGLTSSDISDGQAADAAHRTTAARSTNRTSSGTRWEVPPVACCRRTGRILSRDMPTMKWAGSRIHDRLRHLPIRLPGSPHTSYLDVGAGGGGWPVQAWDRGNWVDVTQDPTTGVITVGSPHVPRTPWYNQSDF